MIPIHRMFRYAPLSIVLILGFYMRSANLSQVQHFAGDQGRDYMEVMRWLRDGHWPLLGPMRMVGDYTLGPGWYYTLAPTLGLSGFHPVAGAMTVVLFGVLTAFLAWLWILKSTGSRTAALCMAMVIAGSAAWVEWDRILWSPNLMPFSTVALACLIDGLQRRPLGCLTLCLMLFAILPQWHTTGILLVLSACPFVVWGVARSLPQLRQAPRRRKTLCGLSLLLVVFLLYLPPILYELKPGPGNLRTYLAKTRIPGPPPSHPLVVRANMAAGYLACEVFHKTFVDTPVDGKRSAKVAAAIALVLFLIPFCLTSLRGRTDLSAGYLALLVAGYGVLLVFKGGRLPNYFLIPVLIAPVLLIGWMAGKLLAMDGEIDRRWRLAARGAGSLVVIVCLGLTALQIPQAWGIHQGRVWYGHRFAETQTLARFIIQDANSAPFSVMLIKPGDFPAHFHYLLRYFKHPPKNQDYYSSIIPKEQIGEKTYIIVMDKNLGVLPIIKGFSTPLDPPVRIGNADLYRIKASQLPQNATQLDIRPMDQGWIISVM